MKKIGVIAAVLFTLNLAAQASVSVYVQASTIYADTLNAPNGWIRVYKDMYVGYINEEGEEIVPAVYDEIGSFNTYTDGWALVTKNGLMGFIDIDGNEVVRPQYESIGSFDEYREGWLLVGRNGYIGFIDKDGNEVVAPQYTDIAPPANHE